MVVVSARSGVTNELIARAKAIQKSPSDREMDVLMTCGEQETIALLCMALDALDVSAVSELVGRRESLRMACTESLGSEKFWVEISESSCVQVMSWF